ncbi:MAG: MFS transporter [Conexivisphaera sp.]|nr:MFS transporter [Conexivisphaerales archaeon]
MSRPWRYPRSYLRLITFIVALAALLTPIDSTITSVSLPYIAEGVRAGYVEALWIPLGYLSSLAALLLPFGRLGDIRGRRSLMIIGFAVFSVGTAMSGLSSAGLELDAWRVLQGVGGAMIMANAGALISEVYPPWERGRAFGYYTMAVYVGTVAGPLIGGMIVSYPELLGLASWRWVFFVTLPPAAAGLLASWIMLREPHDLGPGPAKHMDVRGMALSIPGLFALMAGVTEGSFVGWDPASTAALAAGAILLAAFLLAEARSGRDALMDISLFSNPGFTAGNLAALLNYAGFYFLPFFLSYYMQRVLGYPPSYASEVLLAIFLSMVVLAPLSGRLSDRIGSRGLATGGMALIAAGIASMAMLGTTATAQEVMLRALAVGVGMGLFSSPNTAAVMRSSPRERLGTANATLSTVRVIGQALSLAIAGSLAAVLIPRATLVYIFAGLGSPASVSPVQFVEGLRIVYGVMAVLVAAGAVASAVRGREVVE